MNYRIIGYILGWVLILEALFMIPSCLVGLLYQESEITAFLLTICICLLIGIPFAYKKPRNKVFYIREGFVTVAFSWIVMSIMGA